MCGMLVTIQFRKLFLPIFSLKSFRIKICKTIIFSVVLYGCETWSLMFREEHGLRMFENRVLRRAFGCNRK
jgi:hypothetical protein